MRRLVLIFILSACALAQERQITVEKYEVPKYPMLAVNARIGGDVVLFLRVDRGGNVESVRIERGHPMLAPAAVEASKAWRFHCWNCTFPDGFEHRITFSFKIIDSCYYPDHTNSFQFPHSIVVGRCQQRVNTSVTY